MSLRKNFIYNLINQISAVLFPIISIPYVSRILGVQNIGLISFVTSYTSYFLIFANLGISVYGVREIARMESKVQRSVFFSEVLIILFFTSVISSALYLLSIFIIEELRSNLSLFLISGFSLFLGAFNFDWFFSGRENFKMITIRSLTVKVISLFLLFLLVKTKDDVMSYCSILVFSTLMNQFWNFGYMLKNEISLCLHNIDVKRHFKPLFVFLGTNLAISVYTLLDTLMLGFLSSYDEVGYYSSATKLIRVLLPFAVASTSIMVPKISKCIAQGDAFILKQILNKSFSLVCFFSVPMTIGLMCISKTLVPIFFGVEFINVTPVLMTMSSILLLVGLSNFFGIQILSSIGLESKLLLSILVGATVNFSLNLLFIKSLGAIGAAIASVLAEFIILILTFLYVKNKVMFIPDLKYLKEAVYSSIVILIILFIDIESIYLKLGIQILLGITIYLLMQGIVFKNKVLLGFISKLYIFK